jgi:tyrosyl-tRNA synthetase
MWDWWLLLTDLPTPEIDERRRRAAAGELHPKAVKQELALRLTAQLHGDEAARAAAAEFERVFAGGGAPEQVPAVTVAAPITLQKLLTEAGLAPSNSESRRLLQQGAVSVDGERAADPFQDLPPRAEPYLLKVGKRRFARVRVVGGS